MVHQPFTTFASALYQIYNSLGKLGNIVSATKMFLNFLGKTFASWEGNFVSATINVSRGGQTGKNDRKHNVSATLFPQVCPGLNRLRY